MLIYHFPSSRDATIISTHANILAFTLSSGNSIRSSHLGHSWIKMTRTVITVVIILKASDLGKLEICTVTT